MREKDLLHIPRLGPLGKLLDVWRDWPVVGCHAAKFQRVRRKRFLTGLRAPIHTPYVQRVLDHQAGREFASAMKHWLQAAGTDAPPKELEPISKPPADGREIRCSVVINTLDRAKDLALTLDDLLETWDEEKDELIVVLGPSADESVEVLRNSRIRHRMIHCADRNLSVSRNLGLQAARGRFVAYLDDDASPEPGWLKALLDPLEREPDVAVSAGFVLDGKGREFLIRYVVADTLGRALFFENESDAMMEIGMQGKDRAFLTATGCNMAFKREVLATIGGFDPAYRYFLEETDAVRRLYLRGFRLMTAPSSLVRHRLAPNLARSPGFQIEDRIVLVRSQIRYIHKFGRATFPDSEIEIRLWERVLRDLEKIAWDCAGIRPKHDSPQRIQGDYLRAVTAILRQPET